MNNTLLLIEADNADAKLILDALADPEASPFDVQWVTQLADGLKLVGDAGIGLILLDPCLPDSLGIASFEKLFAAAPQIPILVLGRLNDESAANEAIRHGAQDYLLKSRLDKYTLTRTLRHVIERKKAEELLFVDKERAQVTLNCIGDAVLSTNIFGDVSYLNLAAESMTGWSREDALGRPLAEVFQIIDGGTREAARSPL